MSERRPYANVEQRGRRWSATHPGGGPGGRNKYLGSYDSPTEARQVVLRAQAEHLEAKAQRYRDEAENL